MDGVLCHVAKAHVQFKYFHLNFSSPCLTQKEEGTEKKLYNFFSYEYYSYHISVFSWYNSTHRANFFLSKCLQRDNINHFLYFACNQLKLFSLSVCVLKSRTEKKFICEAFIYFILLNRKNCTHFFN